MVHHINGTLTKLRFPIRDELSHLPRLQTCFIDYLSDNDETSLQYQVVKLQDR